MTTKQKSRLLKPFTWLIAAQRECVGALILLAITALPLNVIAEKVTSSSAQIVAAPVSPVSDRAVIGNPGSLL